MTSSSSALGARCDARDVPRQSRRFRLAPGQGPTSERSDPVDSYHPSARSRRSRRGRCRRRGPRGGAADAHRAAAKERRLRRHRVFRRQSRVLSSPRAARRSPAEMRQRRLASRSWTNAGDLTRARGRPRGRRASRRDRQVRSTYSGRVSSWEPTAVIPRSHARSRRRSTSHTTPRERCSGDTGTRPAFWRTDPAYPFGMYVANTDGHIRVIFQTDHDQLLIGSLPPVEQAMAWRTDLDAALIADLASDSTTGPLIAGSAPEGRIRGTVKERYFFRRAAGNGWTLVGDAGHHKEFVIGDGITEALLQARSLASAIARGTDAALQSVVAGSGRRGAAVLLPRTGRRGARPSDASFSKSSFRMWRRTPGLRARMAATMEHQLSPFETFPVRQVLWWTLAAAFRGSLAVVPDFITIGRRGSAANRELRLRRRLLADAEASEERAKKVTREF